MTVGTLYEARYGRSVSAPLWEDILTDWIPDAIGARALEPSRRRVEEFRGRLEIHTRMGRRAVPVPSLEFRCWASATTEAALSRIEQTMGPSVYGYRDAVTPYRQEWARLSTDQDRLWETSTVCLRLDIDHFFESTTLALISKHLPSSVVEVCAEAHRSFDQALIPGHRWSRRVANALLWSLDALALEQSCGRIQRWQDDYWVFADSESEARELASDLNRSLSSDGLHATPAKFGSVQRRPLIDDQRLLSSSATRLADDALKDGDISRIKYLMRWFAERAISEPLPRFGEAAKQWPVLAPRLATWIASCSHADEAKSTLHQGLQTDDLWVLCRLTAAACHDDRLVESVSTVALEELSSSNIAAARGLAARIQRLRGLARVSASERIDGALGTWSDAQLWRALPVVETTL